MQDRACWQRWGGQTWWRKMHRAGSTSQKRGHGCHPVPGSNWDQAGLIRTSAHTLTRTRGFSRTGPFYPFTPSFPTPAPPSVLGQGVA